MIIEKIDDAMHILAGIDLRTIKDEDVRQDIKAARSALRDARTSLAAAERILTRA